MNREQFRALDDTEVSDFATILNDAGFLRDDFELNEADNTRSGVLGSAEVRLYSVNGVAIVTRISKGIARQYQAGYSAFWVVDFQKDLEAGIFGRP